MKNIMKFSFVVLAIIATSSCQKIRNSQKPEFKYYNFCPDGPDLLLLVDNWNNFPKMIKVFSIIFLMVLHINKVMVAITEYIRMIMMEVKH